MTFALDHIFFISNFYAFRLFIDYRKSTVQFKRRVPSFDPGIELVDFGIFPTAYIIGESLVAYQIGYVADRCTRRQFQTLIL